MPILILLRHGQSAWNLENRFTGETDIELTVAGKKEAAHAGTLLRGYPIDLAYTSVLKRAIHTLDIVLKNMGTDIPVTRSAALNERSYGSLQGLNKAEVEKQYGSSQLFLWRRSYDAIPPDGESLEHTHERVIAYYIKEIEPGLKEGKNVLIVAHGNSLRSLMMYLENITPANISGVEIATGLPRVYTFTPSMQLTNVHYVDEENKNTRY